MVVSACEKVGRDSAIADVGYYETESLLEGSKNKFLRRTLLGYSLRVL